MTNCGRGYAEQGIAMVKADAMPSLMDDVQQAMREQE